MLPHQSLRIMHPNFEHLIPRSELRATYKSLCRSIFFFRAFSSNAIAFRATIWSFKTEYWSAKPSHVVLYGRGAGS
ncbi:hypothetical protein RvY_07618 [Ramazzottius varieornatus]|uniref:Uncharacterized protein n=1 Tax=Ramazzottius varieornatus TaxID=947166 RepID=A0A1D1V5F9_RAMVA|nr:hypothetical protein RvY_07618 [Ramazzottius varieornatus]